MHIKTSVIGLRVINLIEDFNLLARNIIRNSESNHHVTMTNEYLFQYLLRALLILIYLLLI